MNPATYIVVTSINAPNAVLRDLAAGSAAHGAKFIVVGDTKSPPDFALERCDYYDVGRQIASGLRYAAACPTRTYARKNIGYLLAIRQGAQLVVETDDDNFPCTGFWAPRQRRQTVKSISGAGWVNPLPWFTEAGFTGPPIWPRGLPLDQARVAPPDWVSIPVAQVDCPIQMGLADQNPDVDAIYRLVMPLPVSFRQDRRIAFGNGTWVPFNSQNTTWWPDAFPLLYLPSHCTMRATDIWRGQVALRVAWAHGWQLLYHEPTVRQERNEHCLLSDFEQEIPVYLQARKISAKLASLSLSSHVADCGANLQKCYQAIVELGLIDARELDLISAWLADLAACNAAAK